MKNDCLTEKIIACCFQIHNELGPGFHEKIYRRALKILLNNKELKVNEEKVYKISFQGLNVGILKLDILVENKVVVELKAIAGIMPTVFQQQIISYLKATNLKVGLLVNFGSRSCQIRRIMNNHCNHNFNHCNHI